MDHAPADPPKAVLFDLDGTLYPLEPVRRRMARSLLVNAALHPLRGPRAVRVLRSFRSVREDLRALGDSAPSLDEVQYTEAARVLGVEPTLVRGLVQEWMLERPLTVVGRHGWPALRSTLAALKGWELPVGVLSDYPVDDKLRALGIDDMVDVRAWATEPEINAFKPHPRGFLVAAERMGVAPEDVAYVGDRLDVDAVGARAAGMRCVILGTGGVHPGEAAGTPLFVETIEEVPLALGLG